MSIKTNFEIPRGDDIQLIQKQGQRLSQDLSSNFKAINNSNAKLSKQISSIVSNIFPVGTIIHSMLTLDQFQTEMGLGWVLSNGQSAIGSLYGNLTGATIVPDVTGRVLRGQGANNPDGVLALGAYQSDAYYQHRHDNQFGFFSGSGTGPVVNQYLAITAVGNVDTFTGSVTSAGLTVTGENETRMKNITVNIFIRIN